MENNIYKFLKGESSGEAHEELNTWLQESPENTSLYNDYSKVYSETETAFDHIDFDVDTALEKFKTKINSHEAKEELYISKRSNVVSMVAKIAASVALVLGAFFVYNQYFNVTEIIADAEVETISLPDNSTVWLRKGSSIRFNNSFKSREVELTGEAYFSVEERGDKFVVTANGTETEVLGTEFMLKQTKENNTVLVVVTGKVAFSSGRNSVEKVLLAGGEQAMFEKTEKIILKDNKANLNNIAWKTGVLKYEAVPLEQVVEDLEQLHNVEIEFSNPQIRKCPFSGTFEQLSLEEITDIISYSMEVNFSINGSSLQISGIGCEK